MNKRLPSFDILARLAVEQPAALEALRQRTVDECIRAAPPERQARLRGLQWQIDMTRQQASNPLDACVSLSRLMYDSLSHLRDALDGKPDSARRPAAGVVSLAAARHPDRRKRK